MSISDPSPMTQSWNILIGHAWLMNPDLWQWVRPGQLHENPQVYYSRKEDTLEGGKKDVE